MRNRRFLLSVVLLAVFAVSTTFLLRSVIDSFRSSDAYAEAQELAQPQDGPSTRPVTPPEALPVEVPDPAEENVPTYWVPVPVADDETMDRLWEKDLDALREKNPDVIGWIHIPDTKIDYPIVQGEDNTFYLDHNWRGESLSAGSIFLECRNSPDFTDYNTIVYGHNMVNDTMFGSLNRYGNQAWWESHPYIYILLDYGVLRYEVFSSYTATVGSNTYALSFRQTQTREDYLQMAADLSEIDTGITPEVTDLVLTLSTCHGVGDTRWTVHARLPMMQYIHKEGTL